ncbi:MAG: hypothetical protein J7J44_07015 [Deltaproteobacteria bacterium]|nr:hypothetical protein [Deltaproteobacteria bacterium]
MIYRKGYLKIDEISRELGVPKSLVEQIIQGLINKEYLKDCHFIRRSLLQLLSTEV